MNDSARFRIDRRAVARAADRASTGYTAAAQLPARVAAELLERLQFFRLKPRVIIDLGCGTGVGAAALRRRFPRARVVAVDLALGMTRQARRGQRFWRRFDCLCADACALPLKAQSVDLVFSNLMVHSCDDPAALFTQVQRVLRPGGLLLFSSLGPDTLHELRSAWAAADTQSHVSAFADMSQLGAAISHAGLAEPVIDREIQLRHHPKVRALMDELRASGASHAAADRRRGLTGPGRMRLMVDAYELHRTPAGLPASWEVIYGAAFAGTGHTGRPGPGSDRSAGETAVPVSAVRPRRSTSP